eukprot:COSAG04_NODE_19294_length_419_cov_1.715625_1_plen_52_part_10
MDGSSQTGRRVRPRTASLDDSDADLGLDFSDEDQTSTGALANTLSGAGPYSD